LNLESKSADLLTRYRFGTAEILKFQLHNGLKIIFWEDHRAPVLSYQTWFGVGSRHERVGRTGMAHLFEHLMFKGTKNMPEGRFDKVLEGRGAQTNAATWVDWTHYRARLPAGNLKLICELEADRMENMLLTHDQLESEREVVVNERLLRVENDPDGTLYEALYKLAYGNHPYGWPTIGWMEDIRAITLEDCFEFYRTYYAPNNAVISIVGDMNHETALEEIHKAYGHLQGTEPKQETPHASRRAAGPWNQKLSLDIVAERVIHAWHAVAADDPDHAVIEVMDEILTGGESSRVHLKLVSDLELANDAGGWLATWKHAGLYELSFTVMPGHRPEQITEVLEAIIQDIKTHGVTEKELIKAKHSLEASLLREIADTSSRARGLAHAEVVTGDCRWFLNRLDAWREVRGEDIQRVANQLFATNNRSIVVGETAQESSS
jgi:zinc protease